jgi:hypothetical protein
MNFNPTAPPVYKPTLQKVAEPRVYRPEQGQQPGVQLKQANNFRTETRPAPPVYRPQQSSKADMQLKPASNFRLATRPTPPIYRPEQALNPRVQAKPSVQFRIATGLVPPACRPQQVGISATEEKLQAAPGAKPYRSIYMPVKAASVQLKIPSTMGATVIQRMNWDPVEQAKAEMRGRQEKKERMAQFAQGYDRLYRKPRNSPELRMVNSLSFGGNRSSAALIMSASGDTIYVAEQHGGASKAPEEIWDLSGAEVIAADSECSSGLHSEMQTIVVLLREWQSSGHEYLPFGINTAEDFLISRIGGGKAVAKGKGCCQLCAAILLKLGVKVAFIEPSKYESTWQDPFEFVGLENPWF